MVTATFLTEDSYLGNQTEPLTLNRYNYCVSSYLNYTDPSGNSVEINIPLEEFEQAQTYGDIYRLLEKYIIIEAQRMEAEHNAREQEMLNGMQRDYDSGFMKAIMELESDIGISGIYNIVVSPLRYAYQGSSDPYGEAIRNRRQNSQNFYVGVAQFGFDIVDPITHPELITGRIYSGMFAVTNDPGILFQDPMGPALDAWDAVWTDDDQTHFNKTGYLFGQILAAVGLGCAKSCIDEGLANTTTRTGAIEDRKGTVYGVAESGTATINPNDIRFSQSSVNGASEIIDSMKAKGWDGDPIDVVRMPDGNLTTIDNTRVLAARYAEIDVQANVHAFDEVLPQDLDLIERLTTPKGVPQTWGDAVLLRIGKQNSGYRNTYPLGSNIIGWSGN